MNSPGLATSPASPNGATRFSPIAATTAPIGNVCDPMMYLRAAFVAAPSAVASEAAVDPTPMAHWSTVAVVATATTSFMVLI